MCKSLDITTMQGKREVSVLMAELIYSAPVWLFFKYQVILGNVLNKTMYSQPSIYMTVVCLENSLYNLITQKMFNMWKMGSSLR